MNSGTSMGATPTPKKRPTLPSRQGSTPRTFGTHTAIGREKDGGIVNKIDKQLNQDVDTSERIMMVVVAVGCVMLIWLGIGGW